MPASAIKYRFGPFEIHILARELYQQGSKLRLRPQPFRVLEVLVERAGEVVRRDELRHILWPSETYVDFERGLNTSIKEIRSRLNDSATEPRYIETLPKLGYRLIIPVEAVPDSAKAALPEPQIEHLKSEISPVPLPLVKSQPSARRLRLLSVAVLLLVLAGLGGYRQWQHSRIRPQAAGRRLMLAVLPIENLTGDAGQEYLSDGLTEEMIAQLGRLDPDHLGVIARTSVMHYKDQRERIAQIGRELNVQYVLEGSLRKDSASVRVSARLIRVRDELHVWGRQYDRKLTNLLTLQDEIAHEISDEIELTLGTPKRSASAPRRSLSDQEYQAYDLYLKGLYFWNKRTVEGFRKAIGYFQQAIAMATNDARSYAGLADCYALLGGYTMEPLPEYMIQARAAALHALELDETLPEAHTALALIVENFDWDWQTAEKEFQRAIQLNPNYATAHHWYAEHLGYRARFDEAFQESERARQLDPLSVIISADNGALLYYSRQYDRALAKLQSVLEMDPHYLRSGVLEGLAYVGIGQPATALSIAEPEQRMFGDQPWFWSHLALVAGRAGKRAEALQALEKLKQLYRPEKSDPSLFVAAYLGLGDKENALAWMEKAYSQHANSLTTLKVDPVWDPLRGDPRFQELMRRVGLAK